MGRVLTTSQRERKRTRDRLTKRRRKNEGHYRLGQSYYFTVDNGLLYNDAKVKLYDRDVVGSKREGYQLRTTFEKLGRPMESGSIVPIL
ncbi:hypothetical protein N7486_005427 [Penicillium sp. IBT 16267x]|nr:hypothetical protein N7486_005427 [Penicillium sp. IBT 16267x]